MYKPSLLLLVATLLMLGCSQSDNESVPTPDVAASDPAATGPNILFIVGDDIGFGDLGISGAVTRTPTLDSLAQQGTFFTNFHVSPVCSVTRSMMLTGNDPIEIGLAAFDYTVYPPVRGATRLRSTSDAHHGDSRRAPPGRRLSHLHGG
jgi:hypothetical protein